MARRNKGVSLIEVLVSLMILTVSLMAMMGLWQTNMKLTEKHGDATQAYNIGRMMMEDVKRQGFKAVPEGTTIYYFDADGGQQSTTQTGAHKFKVTQTVVSDILSTTGTGAIIPGPDAIRDVKVTVVRMPGNVEERVTGTLLVRSGV